MKIAFVGDSLTQGIPGVGYLSVLEKKLQGHELLNYGRGGDTVVSLLRRIKKIKFPEDLDIIVLEVGVNDVFVNVAKIHLMIRTLLRQPWTTDLAEFELLYREIVQFLSTKAKRLIAITPVLLGEDIHSRWAKDIAVLSDIMARVISDHPDLQIIDARGLFCEKLKDKKPSDYLSRNPFSVISDVLFLWNPQRVNKKSLKRGLHYSLDGVHLNTFGAEILADAIIEALGGLAIDAGRL